MKRPVWGANVHKFSYDMEQSELGMVMAAGQGISYSASGEADSSSFDIGCWCMARASTMVTSVPSWTILPS
jgi:hypothetical protein